MAVCWFAQSSGTLPDVDLTGVLASVLASVPGATRALIHTPAATHDPYLNDGASPSLALQVYFSDIAMLEAALTGDGALMALPSLLGPEFDQQAMLVRGFPVANLVVPDRRHVCTYLVAYEGATNDLPAWLAHYLRHHAVIMTRFPGIRQVEVCTRVDWCGELPWRRVGHMQRNKVVFDDQQALTAALNSPVRHEMRADFEKFPPFTGPVSHFPMLTKMVPIANGDIL